MSYGVNLHTIFKKVYTFELGKLIPAISEYVFGKVDHQIVPNKTEYIGFGKNTFILGSGIQFISEDPKSTSILKYQVHSSGKIILSYTGISGQFSGIIMVKHSEPLVQIFCDNFDQVFPVGDEIKNQDIFTLGHVSEEIVNIGIQEYGFYNVIMQQKDKLDALLEDPVLMSKFLEYSFIKDQTKRPLFKIFGNLNSKEFDSIYLSSIITNPNATKSKLISDFTKNLYLLIIKFINLQSNMNTPTVYDQTLGHSKLPAFGYASSLPISAASGTTVGSFGYGLTPSYSNAYDQA